MRPRKKYVQQLALASLMGFALLAATANAAPPAHAGHSGRVPPGLAKHMNGHGHGPPGRHDYRRGHGDDFAADLFFTSRRRDIIRSYYLELFNAGHCPPGLAKKHNGCMPPGQARKWRIGHRLPADVIYYSLPHALARRLGADDPAYKLIRVGSDILRIAVGTGVVVDALEDLGEMH